jgi:SAM-dependent methyltransferase
MSAHRTGGLRSTRGLHRSGDAWLGALTEVDRRVLALVEGPALDVGCGPARHTVALGERGIPALGIDITSALLAVARPRGAPVLERDVFERVPAEGRWGTVLLLDGNIGIGGDVVALLWRVAALVRPDGIVLVELETDAVLETDAWLESETDVGRHDEPTPRDADRVRVEVDGAFGPWFPWTSVPVEDLDAVVDATPLTIAARWFDAGRAFALLRRRRRIG